MKAILFALLASLVWGSAPLLFKLGLKGSMSYMTALIIHNFTAFCVALFILLITKESWSFNLREGVAVALGGFMSGFLGLFLFFKAIRHGDVSVVSPIASTSPLWASLLAHVLLGESMSFAKLVGILLTVAGVSLLSYSSR